MLFLLLCVFTSGCGGKAKNSNSSNAPSTSAPSVNTPASPQKPETPENPFSENQKSNITVPKPDSPQNAFHAFQAYVARGEFEKIYDLYSSADRKSFDSQAKTLEKNMKKQPPPADAIALLKKHGISGQAMTHPQGKDLLRLSLVFIQVRNETTGAASKQQSADTIKEFQNSIATLKLEGSTKSRDGKTADLDVMDSSGQTHTEKAVLENGQWKLVGEKMQGKP